MEPIKQQQCDLTVLEAGGSKSSFKEKYLSFLSLIHGWGPCNKDRLTIEKLADLFSVSFTCHRSFQKWRSSATEKLLWMWWKVDSHTDDDWSKEVWSNANKLAEFKFSMSCLWKWSHSFPQGMGQELPREGLMACFRLSEVESDASFCCIL